MNLLRYSGYDIPMSSINLQKPSQTGHDVYRIPKQCFVPDFMKTRRTNFLSETLCKRNALFPKESGLQEILRSELCMLKRQGHVSTIPNDMDILRFGIQCFENRQIQSIPTVFIPPTNSTRELRKLFEYGV